MDASNYRLVLVMRAVSRITQMKGKSGNHLLINRDEVLHNGEACSVPSISSNSLRHVLIREPGGEWLIDAYGLAGSLGKEELRLLLGGGNNAWKSGGAENLAHFAAMREYWPLLGLMGCGLPDSPKPGVLKMGAGVLVCNETHGLLSVTAKGACELPQHLRAARTCVEKWQNYRHDPTRKFADLLSSAPEESDRSDMPYSGEAIMSGSLLVSEIHLDGATPTELGALLWSLRLWQAGGCYVGGMSARGNGRLEAMLYVEDGDSIDIDAVAREYVDYAMSVRNEALDWLRKTYETEKPDKAKKGKKKAEVSA